MFRIFRQPSLPLLSLTSRQSVKAPVLLFCDSFCALHSRNSFSFVIELFLLCVLILVAAAFVVSGGFLELWL